VHRNRPFSVRSHLLFKENVVQTTRISTRPPTPPWGFLLVVFLGPRVRLSIHVLLYKDNTTRTTVPFRSFGIGGLHARAPRRKFIRVVVQIVRSKSRLAPLLPVHVHGDGIYAHAGSPIILSQRCIGMRPMSDERLGDCRLPRGRGFQRHELAGDRPLNHGAGRSASSRLQLWQRQRGGKGPCRCDRLLWRRRESFRLHLKFARSPLKFLSANPWVV